MTMKAKFKHEWDYLGWKQYSDGGLYDQHAWNETVVTKINQSSAQIGKESYRGGGNNIFVHPKTFMLLKDLAYFSVNGSEAFLAGRFKIHVDESLDPDKIYVKHIDKDFEKVKENLNKPNLCRAFKIIKVEGQMSELEFKFIEREGDDEFTWDGFKFITDDMITAEITIKNHRTIDPVTGEILIDYHNEIPQDIWMGTRPNEPELSDLVMVRDVKTDDLKALLEERIEALKKLSNPLITPEPYEKQLANLNDIKITVKKPWYKRIFEFFKPTEQVKIKNVKNSKINIKIK